MEKVGVVICNYNKAEDVLICVQSVLESKFQDYHVYVVDNASSDSSVEAIQMKYGQEKKVTILCNQENLGGSGGFNAGLREALKQEYKYLMCIDNDAFLDESCMGELVSFLDQTPEAGIAAAKICCTENADYIQQYGSFIDWDNYCVNSTYYNCLENGTLPEVVYSDAVPACALMIRRSVIEQIGLMPEENFLYWDDTEWCYRCKAAGYQIASVGAAMACHKMGARKEDVNTFPTYYAWRNWIYFFLKYIPDEKLDDFATVFLGSIFELQYEGLYNKEPHRARTVMAALDDALHGRMGRAGENRIFELSKENERLEQILQDSHHVCIFPGKYGERAEYLQEQIKNKHPEIEVDIEEHAETADVRITLCESIFQVNDFSRMTYYMDLSNNILMSEDDVFMVVNYSYSKRTFLFAEKPLFLELATELRQKIRN